MQQALHSRASHASRGHYAQSWRLDKAAVRPVAAVASPTATTAVDSMAAKPEKTYKNGILFQGECCMPGQTATQQPTSKFNVLHAAAVWVLVGMHGSWHVAGTCMLASTHASLVLAAASIWVGLM